MICMAVGYEHIMKLLIICTCQLHLAQNPVAAASISHGKRRRIILAARHYLMQQRREPPCRFDAMVCDGPLPEQGGSWQWLQAAFDAS